MMNRIRSLVATLVVGVSMAMALPSAWALPSVQDVQASVERGDWLQAERQLKEVVEAKPQSARAHYLYAEVLVHNQRYAQAARHMEQARALDGSLTFTDPQKFFALERALQAELGKTSRTTGPATAAAPAGVTPARVEASGGPSLGSIAFVAGVVVLGVVAWRLVSRRRSVPIRPFQGGPGAAGLSGTPGAPNGWGPGGPGGPGAVARPGMGTVGMAALGGVAAGLLAERLLHGNTAAASTPPSAGNGAGLEPHGGPEAAAHRPGSPHDDSLWADDPGLRNRPMDWGHGSGWAAAGPAAGDAGGGFDSGFDGGDGGGDGGW